MANPITSGPVPPLAEMAPARLTLPAMRRTLLSR